MKNLIINARQFLFPAEFRIAPPIWSEDWRKVLEQLAAHPVSSPTHPSIEDKEQRRFIADLATGVWRLREKMREPGTEKPKEAFRREYRHLESVFDVLEEAGVIIQDHTNKPFEVGQALKKISQIPNPAIRRPRVLETIKPSIYFKGEHIQMGEVIVEEPVENSEE
jgi:hypothetical protein